MRNLIVLFALALSLAAGAPPARAETRTALFAAGCFWCLEADMDAIKGVTKTTTGYAGGRNANPTYDDYEAGGHREVVQIEFDDDLVSFHDLVATFLRTVDVTDAGGQFCDRGHAYTSAIHALDKAQEKAARAAIAEGEAVLGEKIVTPVEGPAAFWPAEQEHQDFHLGKKRRLSLFGYVVQSRAYARYREGCGRDRTVERVWGEEAYRGVNRMM